MDGRHGELRGRHQHGDACRLVVAFVAPLEGTDRCLCGRHAKIARRRPIPLCGPDHEETELDHAGGEGTAEDDDVILVHPDATAAELARRLDRTVWAIKSRRSRLRRRARVET